MAAKPAKRVEGAAPRRAAALVLLSLILALSLFLPDRAQATDATLGDFHGIFVGTAQTVPPENSDAKPRLRDLDIIVEPYKKGFRITWVTVFRVNGKRTDPGVKRRTTVQTFLPGRNNDGIFRQAEEVNMFRRRRSIDLLSGDPVRWARIDARTLSVYSLSVDDRGRYQLQAYHRRLTPLGLDIEFTRLQDGVVDLRVTGQAVRVQN